MDNKNQKLCATWRDCSLERNERMFVDLGCLDLPNHYQFLDVQNKLCILSNHSFIWLKKSSTFIQSFGLAFCMEFKSGSLGQFFYHGDYSI
jgi:hypothetical protein